MARRRATLRARGNDRRRAVRQRGTGLHEGVKNADPFFELALHEQLGADARAASAQARFTSLIVLLLPGLGLLLGELSSPGLIGRMVGSPIGIWLFGSALGLQLGGLLLIRRLSRVQA